MSVAAVLSSSGELLSFELASTRIRVTTQLTYSIADDLLAADIGTLDPSGTDGGSTGTEASGADGANFVRVAADLAALAQAARLRRAYRESCGAVEVPLPEAKITVPEDVSAGACFPAG